MKDTLTNLTPRQKALQLRFGGLLYRLLRHSVPYDRVRNFFDDVCQMRSGELARELQTRDVAGMASAFDPERARALRMTEILLIAAGGDVVDAPHPEAWTDGPPTATENDGLRWCAFGCPYLRDGAGLPDDGEAGQDRWEDGQLFCALVDKCCAPGFLCPPATKASLDQLR